MYFIISKIDEYTNDIFILRTRKLLYLWKRSQPWENSGFLLFFFNFEGRKRKQCAGLDYHTFFFFFFFFFLVGGGENIQTLGKEGLEI